MTTDTTDYTQNFKTLKKNIAGNKARFARAKDYIVEFYNEREGNFIVLVKRQFYLIYKNYKKIVENHETFQPYYSNFQSVVYANNNFWIFESDSQSIWRQHVSNRVPERFIDLSGMIKKAIKYDEEEEDENEYIELKSALGQKVICFESEGRMVFIYVYKNAGGWTDQQTTTIDLKRIFLKYRFTYRGRKSGDKRIRESSIKVGIFGDRQEYISFYKNRRGVVMLINKIKVDARTKRVRIEPMVLYKHNDPRRANPNFRFENIQFCPKTQLFFFTTKHRETGILINAIKIDMTSRRIIWREIIDTEISTKDQGYYKMKFIGYRKGAYSFIFYKTKSKTKQRFKIFSYSLLSHQKEIHDIEYIRRGKIMGMESVNDSLILIDKNLDLTKLFF